MSLPASSVYEAQILPPSCLPARTLRGVSSGGLAAPYAFHKANVDSPLIDVVGMGSAPAAAAACSAFIDILLAVAAEILRPGTTGGVEPLIPRL
jgi:hypothetical protein